MSSPLDRTLHGMTYHKPSDGAQTQLERLRYRFKDAARDVAGFDMDPRCQALVMTKLEEALMWASKGIVLADAE